MNRFYSQNGEDYLLTEFFNNQKKGFFVDVGAFDGIHYSNTYTFEQQGWDGICIEPNPKYYILCMENRPNSICVQSACISNDNNQSIEFYIEDIGLLSGLDCSDKRKADVQERYRNRGLNFMGFEKIKVPARSLNSILGEFLPNRQNIDFITIDVEGRELDVLRGLDLELYSPRILVVEATTDADNHSLIEYLKIRGFHLSRIVVENLFFVNNTLDSFIINSIPINCHLEKNYHPLGDEYTLPENKRKRAVFFSSKENQLIRLVKKPIIQLIRFVKKNRIIFSKFEI